jgi:S1-C subfamily serine protease
MGVTAVLALGAGALMAACGSATATAGSQQASASTAAPAVAPVASSALQSLQTSYVSIVKSVVPSVVQIETGSGLGSGIVFDNKGDVVTNDHVVDGAGTLSVTTSSGRKLPATLVGSFVPDDLAVIHVNGLTAPAATFGDSTALQVGDIVMAIGNPLGLQSSVTSGIVSATGRTVSEGNGVTLPDTIQTSAEINPGNSGGALVDLLGEVVGIPTLAAVDQQLGGGAAPGIGFAIPSSIVKDIASQLIGSGHVTNSHRAYLGVHLASSYGNGAVISSVVTGSPADKAGLKSGDTITAINGTSITSAAKATEALAGLAPGDHAQLTVQGQDGSSRTVTATLGQLPA